MKQVGLVLLQLAVIEQVTEAIVILTGSPVAQFVGWLIGFAIAAISLADELASFLAEQNQRSNRKRKRRK